MREGVRGEFNIVPTNASSTARPQSISLE